MALTDEMKSKLERLAKAMLLGADILDAAGVPYDAPAVAKLMEGHAEVMHLLYPNGQPCDPIDKHCKCAQPLDHGVVQ